MLIPRNHAPDGHAEELAQLTLHRRPVLHAHKLILVILQPPLEFEVINADFKPRDFFGIDVEIHQITTFLLRGGTGGAAAEPPRRAPCALFI